MSSANSLNSPNLPPLKFHSSLLQPRNLAFGYVNHDADDGADSDETMEDDFSEDEVVSAPNNLDYFDSPMPHTYDEEQLFGSKPQCQGQGHSRVLKTGLANQNLTIQVPDTARRFTDGELGFNRSVQKKLTPASRVHLQKQVHLPKPNCPHDTIGLGTPSAPPIIDADFPLERDSECSVRNEPTDRGSWPSRESLDYDGSATKSETSIEQKPNNVEKATEFGERYFHCYNIQIQSLIPYLSLWNSPY